MRLVSPTPVTAQSMVGLWHASFCLDKRDAPAFLPCPPPICPPTLARRPLFFVFPSFFPSSFRWPRNRKQHQQTAASLHQRRTTRRAHSDNQCHCISAPDCCDIAPVLFLLSLLFFWDFLDVHLLPKPQLCRTTHLFFDPTANVCCSVTHLTTLLHNTPHHTPWSKVCLLPRAAPCFKIRPK